MMVRRNIHSVTTTAFLCAVIVACNQPAKQEELSVTPKEELIFPQGSKITNNNFSGTAWLSMLVESDTTYDTQIGNVTFEPGARSNWHYHPGGQILLVTKGKGLYQEKGKPIETMEKGDVVKCPPNVIHWHGATPTDTLVHVAISPNTDKGSVVWLEKVSDEEYKQPDKALQ